MRPAVKNIKNFMELKSLSDENGVEVLERAGGAARAWIFNETLNKNILAVFPDERHVEEFAVNIKNLFKDFYNVFILKELPLSSDFNSDSIKNNNIAPLLLERGETLKRWLKLNNNLNNNTANFLAATPGALMTPCASGEDKFVLKTGNEYKREDIISWLDANGFTRSDLVWRPGQYAPRGFIVDIYDPAYALPRRLEFFDDTLENIAAFKPSTQRTIKADVTRVTAQNIYNIFEIHGMQRAESFMPLDMLNENINIVIFEPQRVQAQAESFSWLFNELYADKFNILTWNEALYRIYKFQSARILNSGRVDFRFETEAIPSFRGNLDALINFCHELNAQDYKINVFTSNSQMLELLGGISNLNLNIKAGSLTSGFLDKNLKQAFISDCELSGITSYDLDNFNDLNLNLRTPLEWREQLSVGQLVIHEDYGLGIFRGIESVVSMGSTHDAIILEFAEAQRLLVPVLQSHKITPLAEHENEENKSELGSLRGSKWRRKIEKDKERAKEEAKILIEIFARRELERRKPLEPTGELYKNFVDAFPYAETADQIKAINEIMSDFSNPFPMDRLLVGDVGFGKTEVAMRAAFRAITSGYQVCVLVPTTILAQQHYATFQARFAGFPVTIGLLSRFVSKKNIEKTLNEIETGKIDILIGTHKLLQKGVNFKNLGLLVIDEEHRFGVMHKEGLKKIYGAVDILSLSATPIPRTLAMALRGLRSISVLSTPPEDRLPVATFAGPWNTSLMRKAVAYELNRGGQVYFLANRISRMEAHKKMLEIFFPEANIKIAHGQMPGRELENTMLDFYSGKIDILVATTIIESGLDIGRANTIIIDDAQELGLAQMYQLKGRVGRRGENAFAYFFYPADKQSLKRETVDRLEAISTMTDLGSGYAIAERDLQIRGSGDIGGTEQHGAGRIGGFHIFYKLLEEELERLRGVQSVKLTDIKFDDAGSIPEKYIPQETVRVTLARRLLQAQGVDGLNAIVNEIRDRFGKIPPETRMLIAITAIRSFGHLFNLESVVINKNNISIKGDLHNSKISAKLKLNKGWFIMGGHAKGPGGLEGAEALFNAMRD